jgi:hypothetical protein
MNRKSKLATFVLALALGAGVVWGSVTGSISGTVMDPSGAVIPGVAVVAHNTETSIQTSTHTNLAGFYSFPALPAGHYEVIITNKGFQGYRQTGLVLDVNSALRVDATLQLGITTQQIEVTSTAVHPETTNTQMGEVIGTTKMTTIPLNGRSYTDLLALQPGVVPMSSGEYSSPAVSGNLFAGNLSVNGQRESANGFMINGGSAQEGVSMGTAVIPNLDSIAEFRILTNNADAEYGHYAGGIVNAITKSGTNQFHGDAFEFVRNPNMDARNFYSSERGVLHQNQFGGTFGGPIRHDKAFFFADYQGTRQVVGVDSGLTPVPSVADKTGNLADVASELTETVKGSFWANTLSQELGYPVTVGEAYYTSGCTSTSECVFPNAVIPQSAFSAPTKQLLKYIPDPNSGPFFSSAAYKQTMRDDKSSYRLDANSRLGMLSGYYFIDDFALVNPYGGGNVPGFSAGNTGRAQMVNFGSTKTFGANSVNELRINYLRTAFLQGRPFGGLGVSLSSQGFVVGPNTPGIVSFAPQKEGVVSVTLNDFKFGTSIGGGIFYENTYQALDNFSTVKGTHTLKFGGTFHYNQITQEVPGYNAFGFAFDGSETGVDFADFLLGAPTSYFQGTGVPMYSRSRYYAVYGQDSWRATHNLTLNYGLRWEVSTPWWETHNQIETLVPGLQSRVFPGAPAGWDFPGDPGIPPTLAPTRYNNFAPRIGFAYSPDVEGEFLGKLLGGPGKTSIRAAFGVYFTAFEQITSDNEIEDAPFGYYYGSPVPPMFATPYIDRGTGHNEGQRFPVAFPPLNTGPNHPDNSIDWSQFLPISSSPGFFHDNRLPYSEQYNFSVQRQFGTATLLNLSYVGTQGHRLLADLETNPGNPALCMSVSQPSQVMPGTATCGPNYENGVFYPITGGVINSTRSPFGAAFGSNGWFATMANSNYNSLQATVRRAVGRLEFLGGYTFSKALDNASGWGAGGDMINPVNYKLSKSLAAFDVTHSFVVSYNYHLPLDKLWRPNRLSSGWTITGVTRFSTGLPVFLREPDDHSLLGTSYSGPTSNTVDEPNFIPGSLNITDPRKADEASGRNPYFNKSLFSKEAIGQLGNASRRFFHGPGLNNWDMGLVKDLRITEEKTLQFRAEFFNMFNHTQFANPNGSIRSSTFGFVTGAHAPRIGQVAIKFLF